MNILSFEETLFLHTWLEEFKETHQNYVLYGTGLITKSILSLIDERNLPKPKYIIDHVEPTQTISDIPFKTLETCERSEFDWILIGSNTYHTVIEEQLKNHFGNLDQVLSFAHLRNIEQRTNKWNDNKTLERELGAIFNLHQFTGPYAFYGYNKEIETIIEALKFHKLALPKAILIKGNTHDENSAHNIPIIPIETYDLSSINTILWKTVDTLNHIIKQELTTIVKDKPTRIFSLKDQQLYDEYEFDFQKATEHPFIMNRTVFIALTARCNLHCSYCLTPEQRKEICKEPDLTFEQAKRVLDELDQRVSLLCLAGHGETLMNADLEKIIRYSVDKGIPAVELVTNGTLLTKERALKLAKAGLHHLHVSFDSLDYDYNKQHRGIDIKQILQHAEDYSKFTGLGIVINVVLSHRNLHLISELPKLKERIPTLLGIVLIPANPLSSERAWDEEFEPMDPNEVSRHIQHAQNIAESYGVGLDVPESLWTYNSRMKTRCCHRPFHNIYIYHDGMMKICNYPCNKSDADYQIGNIFEKDASILRMLNSHKYQEFRKQAILGNLPEACRICRHSLSK